VPALSAAADFAERQGINLRAVDGIQIPHHGSKHNVGPTILDRIVGPKLQTETLAKVALVSASADGGPRHPNRRVVNAFMRRGAKVIATQGTKKCHSSPGTPSRVGWSPAVPLPFFNGVDNDE
jgi:beta-lactamase superfamily II metal-dependent hydrolase